MPVRQDKSETSAQRTSLAGYVCLFLAMASALTHNWLGTAGFGVAGIAALILANGLVYRPAVARDPEGITCRFNPWREGSFYVLLVYGPAGMLYAFGQPTHWLRVVAIVGFAFLAVGVAFYAREWRRCLLRITPTALIVSVPALGYALTEIPRERIVSITGGMAARREGQTGPVTQIAYLTGDSSGGSPSSVLIGPTNAKNAVWVTVEQADVLAGLQAWKQADPRDPALLDQIEALLRGQDVNRGALGEDAAPLEALDHPEDERPVAFPPPPVAQPSQWRWLRYAAIGLAAFIGVAAVPFYNNHRSSDAPPAVNNAPQAEITDCPVEGARTVVLPKRAAGEPAVYLPLNPGWTEQTVTPGSSEDTPNLRGLYSNPSIRDNDFTPVIQVDLVRTDSTEPLAVIADDLFGKARKMMSVNNETTYTVCGSALYRADTSGYNPDGKGDRSGTTLLTVVQGDGGARWVAIASIKTRDPSRPEYVSEREALIRGFHAS